MVIVKESCKTQNYYISLEIINNMYIVNVCPLISDCLCGYPEKSITYSINEKVKAYNTYKRYVKKYI